MIDAGRLLLLAVLGVVGVAAAVAEDAPSDAEKISFACKCEQGDTLYYIVESEFRDSGGVPPLLSYSTTIKDRRTIQQKILPKSLRQPVSDDIEDNLITVQWKLDRYEVVEQGMKDTVSYDSVRHLYPPPSIWELGSISGAKITFALDPATGKTEGHSITPGKTSGEAMRRPLSKIAAKCQLNNDNLSALLDDLGPYWMPKEPVRVGETWTRTYKDDVRTFGTVTTALNCTLKSIRRTGGRRIAVVEIAGDVSLTPTSQPAPTSRPGQTTRPTQQKEFSIDRFTCKGSVEFDLDLGELLALNLHRETHFVAKMESEKSGPMELRSASSHILKVKTGHTPPPKPIIVGGPKPPEMPPEEKPPTQRRPPTTRPSTPQRPTTSRPAPSTPLPPSTSQPAITTSRPGTAQ